MQSSWSVVFEQWDQWRVEADARTGRQTMGGEGRVCVCVRACVRACVGWWVGRRSSLNLHWIGAGG